MEHEELLNEERNTPKYSRKSKYGIAMGITLTMVLVVLAVIGIVGIISAAVGESKKTPLVIIDTDVGNDDMMALSIMLDKHIRGDVKIVGITTVNGMMDAYNGSITVLELLQTFGLENDIEVHTGTELRVNASIGHYFNETAWWIVSSPNYYNFSEILHFDNITETELNSLIQGSSAIDYLLSKSSKSDAKETTILCLGPLSNFGFALEQSPDMISKFKKVVFMGGAVVVQGNAPNNVSEWNFYADGEAANLVFSGLGENQPAYLCGLEVANYYTLNSSQIDSLWNASSIESQQSSSYSVPLLWTYLLSAIPASCSFDPVAATYVVYEEPFQFQKMNVQVSTEPGTEGETIDCGNETGPGIAQINVAMQLDINLYYDFLMDIAEGSK